MPVGIYTVKAHGIEVGYSNASKENVVVVDGDITTADFQLEKVALGTIIGKVTDADTGDPVTNVEIFIYNDDYSIYFFNWTNQQGDVYKRQAPR